MAFTFQKIVTGDTNIDRIQSNVANAFNQITGPFIGGTNLTSISVKTTNTSIPHGLGKVPQVWVLTDQNTLTSVARVAWDANTITLIASNACVISLWVN